jgi:myosin heavy subunit
MLTPLFDQAMRDFYDKKLREMGDLLLEKETESEKLSEELKNVDKNHARGKELTERLREKREQVATLKKKQSELTRLTTVASKNQSQIEKLRDEVINMKHKKVDLQKQITHERKTHATEVQKLKKESLQKDRELNKVKKVSDRKAMEAQKSQQVAKSRLDQINQLKTKYKDTEKRQRLLTVKRGVMNKAGLDPIMVGRRRSKAAPSPGKVNGKSVDVDVDTLRDFFDQKVADIGRKESLAEKLAQEWEAHFELTLTREGLTKEGYEESSESIQSADSQIQYKKERIRQLASRLGKRRNESDDHSKGADAYLFDRKFRDIVGGTFILRNLRVPCLTSCFVACLTKMAAYSSYRKIRTGST